MAPRAFTNPAPVTDAAREAIQSFFCELCQKGYSRISELENHEKSYDHQHKKRLKDMKAMTRDPAAAEKARKAEERANKEAGMVSLTPIKIDMKAAAGKSGFKKAAGFKKVEEKDAAVKSGVDSEGQAAGVTAHIEDEIYDPFRPTLCRAGCRCQVLLAEVRGKT